MPRHASLSGHRSVTGHRSLNTAAHAPWRSWDDEPRTAPDVLREPRSLSHSNLELVDRQLADETKEAKSFTFFCQPSSKGPFSPVTKTQLSATFSRFFGASSLFMIGLTRCHFAISSGVGILPVFLSGLGAASVVRMAYSAPAGRRRVRH